MSAQPTYGTSSYYLGEQGASYFEYQRGIGVMGGLINAAKFKNFVQPTDTVIDFGCGGGFLLAALSCARKLGVDVNPAVRESVRRNGVEFYGDLAEIGDKTADVVISNHALEHVPAPLDALRGIYQKLKPGGRLVLCLPIDDWRAQTRYEPGNVDHHLYTWTPRLIGNLLAEAGFAVEPQQIRVLKHAWPRYYEQLFKTCPIWLFDACCVAWSAITKRRQIVAVVSRV